MGAKSVFAWIYKCLGIIFKNWILRGVLIKIFKKKKSPRGLYEQLANGKAKGGVLNWIVLTLSSNANMLVLSKKWVFSLWKKISRFVGQEPRILEKRHRGLGIFYTSKKMFNIFGPWGLKNIKKVLNRTDMF